MERISETSKKSNNLTIRNGIGIGVAANTGNEFYFDTEDFSIISRYTWTEKDGYLVAVVEDGRLIRMHRLLLGASDDTVIDHINQRRNLCIISDANLLQNGTPYSRTHTGMGFFERILRISMLYLFSR